MTRYIIEWITDLIGPWGWVGLGVLEMLITTVVFVSYICEPRDRDVLLYSIRNYVGYMLGGLVLVGIGYLQMS